MRIENEPSLAARFAAHAPETLPGDWDDVLGRAANTRNGGRQFVPARARPRNRRGRLIVLAAAALVVVVVSASAYGTVRHLLTGSGGNRFDAPQWSPDGQRVTFVRFHYDVGSTEVYVMNADGSEQRNLTQEWGREPNIFPIWSPDRRKILFGKSRCDAVVGRGCVGARYLYVMNADGSGVRRLARAGTVRRIFPGQGVGPRVPSPVWSPDGGRIAFGSDRDGRADVYVMNADGSARRRLTYGGAIEGSLAWSPGGRKIAYVRSIRGRDVRIGGVPHPGPLRQHEIYVMNADGTGHRMLARGQDPAWSPDGRRIAFRSARDGQGEIYVVSGDGSGLRRLTRNVASDGGPIWSPDRRQIMFVRWRHANSDIYVVNPDGSGERNLTPEVRSARRAEDSSPAWSPDGRKIVFVSNREGDGQIYVMNADGSGQRRLTRGGP
jgi:Tol biopolymer transport system component